MDVFDLKLYWKGYFKKGGNLITEIKTKVYAGHMKDKKPDVQFVWRGIHSNFGFFIAKVKCGSSACV